MDKLRSIVLAIRALGIKNVLWTLVASLYRDWWNLRYWQGWRKKPVYHTGTIVTTRFSERGGRFGFGEGSLDVTFLQEDIVRITWQPGTPPIPYALAQVDWPMVRVDTESLDDGWVLKSSEVSVHVHQNGDIDFLDPKGRILRSEAAPMRIGEAWEQRSWMRPDERVYGLGERAAPLNRRGRKYRMWNREVGGIYGANDDPLYVSIPVYLGIHMDGSYLIFYENSSRGEFAFVADSYATFRFESGMLRYYFCPGPVQRAFKNYLRLTGEPPLPPKWALGYHQSRWGYKSEQDIREVIEGFRNHRLPLSAIHLDIDYMDGYRVFTIDRTRFPNLVELTEELRQDNIRVVAILDPGIKVDSAYSVYNEGVEDGMVLTLPNNKPVRARVWPGWCVFPDFTSEKTREWWARQYVSLLNEGISGIWHDMNEPATFAAWGEPTLPYATRYAMDGRGGNHIEGNNLYGLLMNRAGFDALQRFRPNRRPWILSRSGWAGMQRFAWNWTGDVETSWEALRQTLLVMLGLSLSGIPFTGSDIGGFTGDPDAELFLRWFELATFTPFFRGHSAIGTQRREPWVYGEEATNIVREYLNLRYALMPYIYTAAWQVHHDAVPMMRPLFWLDEKDENLLAIEDEYLFGDALLLAPVLEQGASARSVYLPSGSWYSYWDDQWYEGNKTYRIEAPLGRLPLFVRAGSVLPVEEDNQLVLHLYAPSTDTEEANISLLYSDAGDGYRESRLDRFTVFWEKSDLVVDMQHQGQYRMPYEKMVLKLHGLTAESAQVALSHRPVTENVIELPALQSLKIFVKK